MGAIWWFVGLKEGKNIWLAVYFEGFLPAKAIVQRKHPSRLQSSSGGDGASLVFHKLWRKKKRLVKKGTFVILLRTLSFRRGDRGDAWIRIGGDNSCVCHQINDRVPHGGRWDPRKFESFENLGKTFLKEKPLASTKNGKGSKVLVTVELLGKTVMWL